MAEEWRDVAGYEGIYQISSEGGLRKADGSCAPTRPDKNGYRLTDLRKNGSGDLKKVHHLVLEAFIGQRPCQSYVADHINGKVDDNRIENLRWVTVSVNHYNRHKASGSSGVVGVRFRSEKKNPWQAYISLKGKFKSIGHFATKELAAAARALKVREVIHHG